MGFDAKYYAAAEEEIRRRKQANLRERDKRRAEIERRFPEYKALRAVFAATGAKIASVVIKGGENIREKIAVIEEENSNAARKISELLVRGGYPSDYLNPIYFCEKCLDSAIAENARCECFTSAVRRLAVAGFNSNSPLALTGFESFETGLYPDKKEETNGKNIRALMRKNFEFCENYAENFHLPNSGLLLIGDTGLGKTHLSLAIAGRTLENGFNAVYGSAPDIFRKIENEHFGRENGNTTDLLQSADLLVLDDLGAEWSSAFYMSVFYNLLNSRMNAGLPLVISTNLDLDELKERYGERVFSRMITMKILQFYGNDIRQLKRRFV
ncbi:MAG: ATP-binding protein [Oscillospiraceae bacterium]|jgi:DNA replication protein DnaC|nr:ATP-binding protein [Oscillospiraceae bacterium]